MLGQVVFIVWRESIEALLVVGILFAWLGKNPQFAEGRKYLWLGVAGGVLAALSLGAVLLWFSDWLEGEREDYFQIGMMLVAAALIVQMVFWMRKHGRTLKRELEQGLGRHAESARWWGMALLVMIAITREGSETVVFLYGMGLGQAGLQWWYFVAAAALGFALALGTFQLLQLGGKVFSWQHFFRFTEFLLLLLASAMIVNSVERMIGLGWLPALVDPLWDSSMILDDATRVGGIVAALTGYRSHPALMLLLLLAGYWAFIAAGVYRLGRAKAA
ncbi:High-affinity iron permease [gamma proteobacterium HdN1]|nr:High-affinity iron permease [gamma proteobacterium HdN1]